MLTPNEKHFLDNLPSEVANKKITISPYSDKIKETADSIISSISKMFPELPVRFMGASGLGISGQNDIDIYALSPEDKFSDYLFKIEQSLGKHTGESPGSIAWKFIKNGYDVEFYLTDPESPSMQRQIKVFETLRNNPTLLHEYKALKENLNGSTFKEYQEYKYDFYHRILHEA